MKKCPDCKDGKMIKDREKGDLVCELCGYIISPPIKKKDLELTKEAEEVEFVRKL